MPTLSADGNTLSGQFFVEASDSIGGEITAVRMDGPAQILQVEPAYLRAGESGRIAIHGVGLSGAVSLGEGVGIVSTVSADGETVVVEARAGDAAAVGLRDVSVGGTSGAGMLAVYSTVDSLRVVPEYTIARVGGGGGPLPSVPAQFEAVGYAIGPYGEAGPDGEAGTDDDLHIGVMAASWSVANFNETAAEMEDTKYAGNITATGLFDPAASGLNQARPFSTNNVGDLAVVAAVKDGDRTIEGSAHLIVTVQRWNDPPIRSVAGTGTSGLGGAIA